MFVRCFGGTFGGLGVEAQIIKGKCCVEHRKVAHLTKEVGEKLQRPSKITPRRRFLRDDLSQTTNDKKDKTDDEAFSAAHNCL